MKSGDRAYWGALELLIKDFYAKLNDPEPSWISPGETSDSLRFVKDVYAQSHPEMAMQLQ